MFCHNTRLSFFACQKDAAGAALKKRLRLSAPANKKIGSGSTLKVAASGGSSSTLKVAAPARQHWFEQ